MIFIKSVLIMLGKRPDSWPFAFWIPFFIILYARLKFPSLTRYYGLIKYIWLIFAILTVSTFFWFANSYLLSPIYLGWIHPQIAGVSWYFMLGHPLYHSPSSAEVYEMLYGPYLYLFTGLVEKIMGPSIFSAKLAGYLFLWVTFVLLYLLLLKREIGKVNSVIALAILTSVIMLLDPEEFFGRADNFIIPFVVVGGLAAYDKSKFSPLILGLAAGVSVDLKVHSILYFLPLYWIAFQNGYRIRRFFVTFSCATLTALLPFLLVSNISISNYITTLISFTEHGTNAFNYFETIDSFFSFMTPIFGVVLASYINNSNKTNETIQKNFGLFGCVFFAFVLLLIPASKNGAGAHHILPFAVLSLLLIVNLLKDGIYPKLNNSLLSVSIFAFLFSWLASCLISGLFISYENAVQLRMRQEWGESVKSDIDGIIDKYGKDHILLMGSGGNEHYDYTYFRTELTFSGQPIGFDAYVWMEMEYTGVKMPTLPLLETTLTRNLNKKKIIWMIPKGDVPFSVSNTYAEWVFTGYAPNPPAYSDNFRSDFARLYSKDISTKYFDLYSN